MDKVKAMHDLTKVQESWVFGDDNQVEGSRFGSCSARCPRPTGDALRDLARVLQDGLSSGLCSHSLSIAVKQWLTS